MTSTTITPDQAETVRASGVLVVPLEPQPPEDVERIYQHVPGSTHWTWVRPDEGDPDTGWHSKYPGPLPIAPGDTVECAEELPDNHQIWRYPIGTVAKVEVMRLHEVGQRLNDGSWSRKRFSKYAAWWADLALKWTSRHPLHPWGSNPWVAVATMEGG